VHRQVWCGGRAPLCVLDRSWYLFIVKRTSIQDLKRNLSALVGAAERGERIVVTRHERAVAVLGPSEAAHVHVGDRFGRDHLVPFLRAPTRGGYLRMLQEDREERV
jgi:prevent-host-death family protein